MADVALRLAPADRLRAVLWVRRIVVLVFLIPLLLSVDGRDRLVMAAPAAPPQWTLHDTVAFTRCRPMAQWPRHQIPTALVVQRVAARGRSVRMSFDRAWAINHNRTEVDDVYVLGACS